MLTARQLLILKCIVEEFVETAEPVGSKTLMTKYQLPYSSATIRNEMSFLEEHGYLEKTHTSSGRVPSTKGYRFYVDTLMQPSVDDEVKNQVSTILGDRHRSLNEIIKESCQILSQLTHLTTVALGPNAIYEHLQNITLVPLSEHTVTAIIVTDKGHVENRNFNIKNNAYMEDLTSCVNVMNELLDGTPMNQVVYHLERDVKPILSARIKEHEVLFNAFLEAFMKFANNNVYFSGKENMLYQPEYNDVNKLRRLVWGVVWTCFARPFPRSMAMGWKRMLLRAFGAKIASTAVVYATARVFQPWLLIMDDYACLADGVDCYNAAPIHIGRNATVSQRAFLCTAGHNIMDPHHHQIDAPIVIEEQAWVCAEAFVIQGVTVGQGAVCAARAVVIKDVEPWTVVGGNPAKFIKKRVLINVSGGVNPYLLFYIISRLDAA